MEEQRTLSEDVEQDKAELWGWKESKVATQPPSGPFLLGLLHLKVLCFLHHAVGATSVPQGDAGEALHGLWGIREVLWAGGTAKKPLQIQGQNLAGLGKARG